MTESKNIVLLFILICLNTSSLSSQSFSKIEIYQYEGNDSLNKNLVSVKKFNSKNSLISYDLNGYKESKDEEPEYSYHINIYNKKEQLVIHKFSYNESDSIKQIYGYNDKGYKISEKTYHFEKRLKAIEGFGFPHNCFTNKIEYEENKTWKQTQDLIFKYDSIGNLIYIKDKLDSLDLTEEYLYYDKKNRIRKHKKINQETLFLITKYVYKKNSYEETTNFYDYKGEKEEYIAPINKIYLYNNKGQIIEEQLSIIGKYEKQFSTKKFFYNDKGKIIKISYFYKKNVIPQITHLYVYKQYKT